MSNSESEKSTPTKMLTPSAGYSVTVQLQLENKPGVFSRVVQLVGEKGASLGNVDLLYSDFNYYIRRVTINCQDEEQAQVIVEDLPLIEGIQLLEWQDDTLKLHEGGKLEVISRAPLNTADELSRAYTPGVARVCCRIRDDKAEAYNYTMKGSTVAVVSDGSAVLGLGNIGPEAALPVMEGKAALFRRFAGLNALPVCLDTQDTEELIRMIKCLGPNFGGINLEDISAPRCFEIEERLKKEMDIPVFHDDQHGTAIVVLAGMINALKIVGKSLDSIQVVVNGFGAGGVACTKMLLAAGLRHVIACDSVGILYRGRKERMNPVKEELLEFTNPENRQGTLADALKGADVFIGVSVPGVVTPQMVRAMAPDPIVFALANPTPEIHPQEIEDIARVIATGRSDYANQVNNVLAFPGIFKGAIQCRARDINEDMKVAAAHAIAACIAPEDLHERYIIPSVFRAEIADSVAEAVESAARASGVAQLP